MSCNQKVIWPKTRKWIKEEKLFPAGIEPATLPVWRARDNHYTKETSCLCLQVPMTQCSARDRLPWPMTFGSSPSLATRTCGATDNALDYESRDCRFESCQVRQNLFPHFLCKKRPSLQKWSPPGGLEPPTFRLTAERASRLRHGGRLVGWAWCKVYIRLACSPNVLGFLGLPIQSSVMV